MEAVYKTLRASHTGDYLGLIHEVLTALGITVMQNRDNTLGYLTKDNTIVTIENTNGKTGIRISRAFAEPLVVSERRITKTRKDLSSLLKKASIVLH